MRKTVSLFLAALLMISLAACGTAAPEQTEPVTTAPPETAEPSETTATPTGLPAVDSLQTLYAQMETEWYITLAASLELEKSPVFQGVELLGGGYTLTAPAYVEEDPETQNGLIVRRGVIRDLNIQGGYRALGDHRDHPLTGDVRLINVWAQGQTSALSFTYGKSQGTLNAEGCTFYGWNAIKGFNSAYFENCTFGKGGSEAKGNLRTQIDTTLIGCHFENYTTSSGKVVPYAIKLTDKISGITITMEDCYVGDTLITQENVYDLLEINMYDNVLRVCNTEE